MADTLAFLDHSAGHRLAYRIQPGKSPGVIFLCGFKSDMGGDKASALARYCQQQKRAFLRFDYMGHGQSEGAFLDGSIGIWLQDCLAMIDQCSEGPQIIVGSSMGGWLMLLAALARPQRIAGLIGIATAADFVTRMWNQLDAAAQQEMIKKGYHEAPSHYSDEPYRFSYKLIEEGRQHLLLPAPILLDCPVRLLHGMQDPDVPWQESLGIAEKLRSADVQVHLVKDGDHRLSRPQDLRLLQRVLADLLPAPGDRRDSPDSAT